MYGIVTGVAPGTAIITYTVGAAYSTAVFVVSPTPSAITGPSHWCVGDSVTVSDTASGGVWTSSDVSVLTITASTGIVTGTGPGTAYIYYTTGVGCSRQVNDTTNGIVINYVSGDSAVCAGSTITLTETHAYTSTAYTGAWSSSNTSVATVSSGGVVTGIAAGTADITFTATTTSCGSSSASMMVSVIGGSSAGTISGSSSIAAGTTTPLTETVSGGEWTSSNTSVATVSSGGLVTGIATGTATITYTFSGCSGTYSTTFTISITGFAGISGYVVFSGGYSGSVKVWLIHYDHVALTLDAVDSTVVTCSGDSAYYQFTGLTSDSFRVKASVNDYDSALSTGFIPTYHTSSFYWFDANVIAYFTGSDDNNENILMDYGTVTAGPGFIGGSVTTGANRGTSGSDYAAGLLMVLENATGSVLQQTTTNAMGVYVFRNLPVGTSYTVHPEAINYVSTDYAGITLTTGAPGVSAANFIQHTLSHTIAPGTTGVATVNATASSVTAFPNPTNGALNIKWQESATENGTVTISDITGREVYKTAINMTTGTGVHQLDLSGLTNGLYIISVKSGDINYNSKVQIQH
jgi:hypothetical protein